MRRYISKLVNSENLTAEEAGDAMGMLLDGGATQAQIASYLTALRMKGETLEEIVGSAKILREKAEHIAPQIPNYIDFVGTGGDGVNTFNISSTAAFLVAAAGVPVAKHGNRAISSRSGSADVLEALGVNIMIEPEDVQRCVEKIGIGFMFARTFHKKMGNVSQARADMSIRSMFNLLGPLSNPSGASSQMIGVFSPAYTQIFAKAMLQMGIERALVMNGKDGMDEITTTDATTICEIRDNGILTYEITPEQFGFKRSTPEELRGGVAEENAKIAMEIFNGKKGAKRDITVLNAGAAIYLGKGAASIVEGVKIANEVLDKGLALHKLNQLIDMTNKVG